MFYLVLILGCIGVLELCVAGFFVWSADNSDARATAGLAFLPGIVILLVDLIILGVWQLVIHL